MKYCSTRGYAIANESYTAITKGLADDGGLFVPSEIPKIDVQKLCKKQLEYKDMAYEILNIYLADYGKDTLVSCIDRAYTNNFDNEAITPLVKLDNETYILELWHGPTSAFKDMALQLLPHLLVEGKKKLKLTQETIILVATSGDTGKAALAGFMDVKGTKVVTFYPKDGVAQLQEIQMCTQKGDNVKVVAVEGNFDDTQTGVKVLFSDKQLSDELASKNKAFSSANSINFGRLCPQIVYYFHAYSQMVASGDISFGDKIDFVVPTGNFGDILAGWYAKQMGLPIGKLVCASNSNNILTEFLVSGTYNTNRQFYKTISPSMDILISSNLERLIYEVSDKDGEMINKLMNDLKSKGEYTLDKKVLANIKRDFVGASASENETYAAIKQVWEKHGYLLDTHTAVAYAAIDKIDSSANKKVVLSTANPYKFPDSALYALGAKIDSNSFENIKMLESITNTKAPRAIAELKDAKILHTSCVKADNMKAALEEIINS